MSDIVKANTGLTYSPVKENILLKPNVLDSVRKDVFDAVNASIAKCYADLNSKVPDNPAYLVNEVTDSIFKNYPSLRLQEIPTAFARGIRKTYGEYYGLCVISFEQFIEGYLNSPERMHLVEEKNRLMIEERTEPTIDEKFDLAKQIAIQAFDCIRINSPIGITALTVFEFLNGLELISKDYKTGIMTEALEMTLKIRETEIALCMDIFKRRKLNGELICFRENLEKDILSKEQYDEVLKTAKVISLTNYLRDLAIADEFLGDVIEEHRGLYKEKANARKE